MARRGASWIFFSVKVGAKARRLPARSFDPGGPLGRRAAYAWAVMRNCAPSLFALLLPALVTTSVAAAKEADTLPPPVRAQLLASGLPLTAFGLYVHPVKGSGPLASLNAERPYLMASTAKIVTSLAALDLLGARHRWTTQALAAAPAAAGRIEGDLRIVGGHAPLSRDEVRAWFKLMREQGVKEVRGNIVLDRVALMPDHDPMAPPPGSNAEGGDPAPARPVVMAQPAAGEKAALSLTPRAPGVVLVNEVYMKAGCAAWAQWRDAAGGAPAQVIVRGQWNARCGRKEVAFLAPPPPMRVRAAAAAPAAAVPLSTSRAVAALWVETGGRLRGRVLERPVPAQELAALKPVSTHLSAGLPELMRDINKTSDNVAARHLLLALAPQLALTGTPLQAAQARVQEWLRKRGLSDGDIRIEHGSGQSREERGKPRALAQLLAWAWHRQDAQAFVDSLPIAGVDGTLANRMQKGWAAGHAYLKTGTLGDARALAGYVRGKNGTMYAVAAVVNHPQAARATPALDGVIEWIARNG